MDGGCGEFWSGVAVTQVSCVLVRLVDFMGRASREFTVVAVVCFSAVFSSCYRHQLRCFLAFLNLSRLQSC